MQKTHNFSAGPCILPEDVLEKASSSILNFDNMINRIGNKNANPDENKRYIVNFIYSLNLDSSCIEKREDEP